MSAGRVEHVRRPAVFERHGGGEHREAGGDGDDPLWQALAGQVAQGKPRPAPAKAATMAVTRVQNMGRLSAQVTAALAGGGLHCLDHHEGVAQVAALEIAEVGGGHEIVGCLAAADLRGLVLQPDIGDHVIGIQQVAPAAGRDRSASIAATSRARVLASVNRPCRA